MLTDALTRRALETVVVAVGVTGALALLFWVVRGDPGVPECFVELTVDQRREVDAFRAGAAPLHAGAAGALLAVTARLGAARAGHRDPASQGGRAHRVAIVLYAVVLVASLVVPDVLAVVGVAPALLAFVVLPVVAVMLAVAVIALTLPPARKAAPVAATWVAWAVLLLVVPAHFALVQFSDEPFCMS